MKKKFSTYWKGSKKPRKQRKYRLNAPLHLRGRFLTSHLSKELAQKQGIRRIRLISGDKVKVMRGKFKTKEGKVDYVNSKKSMVTVTGVEISKKDGSKSRPLIHASNLLIIELNLEDKSRFGNKQQEKKQEKK
jgi:large subunit ribosomal protein L24